MSIDFKQVESFLPHVMKPGRYTGGEKNACIKDFFNADARICLVFPDVYEIGMSNLGLQILYGAINKREEYLAERAFAPWKDFGKLLKEKGIPLYSLESKTSLRDFDILGISLQYERLYTNLLYILDLAGIPLLREERTDRDPLIIAGGPASVNPEPMSDFVDLFHIGEADESIIEIMDSYKEAKLDLKAPKNSIGMTSSRKFRKSAISSISKIDSIYNPADYEFTFRQNGSIEKIKTRTDKAPCRRIYYKFNSNKTSYPFIIPNIIPHQDRGTLQVARGCTQGCRFCQAGMTDRPVREKDLNILIEEAGELIDKTGVRELSFNSLSIADYSKLPQLVSEITKFQERGINIGLPSLKVETYNLDLAKSINSLRKTGLTFAIEAGDSRGWNVINKKASREKLTAIIRSTLGAGWRKIKFYFMIGLPFIEDETESIIDLAKCLESIGREFNLRQYATLSVNAFVPKPFTPFQWEGMKSPDFLLSSLSRLKDKINKRYIKLKWNNIELSLLEGALSRADRRYGKIILEAYKRGSIFDGWDEEFNFLNWKNSFKASGMSFVDSAIRGISIDAMLPWEKVNIYVAKKFLAFEHKRATEGKMTPDCRDGKCQSCGKFPSPCPTFEKDVQNKFEIKHNFYKKPIAGKSFKANIFYKRTGLLRFISHLDTINILEKALRMTEIPLNYTEGFNSHPRISYSDPLPLGIESHAEWMTVDLREHTNPKNIIDKISQHLPTDLTIVHANYGSNPRQTYNKVEYEIKCPGSEISFNNPGNKLNFKVEIERKNNLITLVVPYPQPLGIYRILEQITGLEKEKLLNLKIVKTKLYQALA